MKRILSGPIIGLVLGLWAISANALIVTNLVLDSSGTPLKSGTVIIVPLSTPYALSNATVEKATMSTRITNGYWSKPLLGGWYDVDEGFGNIRIVAPAGDTNSYPLNVLATNLFTFAATLPCGVTYYETFNFDDTNLLSGTISLLAYGADPTGVADSAAALRQAMTIAGATPGGGTVLIPPGRYLLSSASLPMGDWSGCRYENLAVIALPTYPVEIVGLGNPTFYTTNECDYEFNSCGFPETHMIYPYRVGTFIMRNLTIESTIPVARSNCYIALYLHTVTNALIDGVTFRNTFVKTEACVSLRFRDCFFTYDYGRDTFGGSIVHSWPSVAIRLASTDSVELDRCDFYGGDPTNAPVFGAGLDGLSYGASRSLNVHDCRIRNFCAEAIAFNGDTNLLFTTNMQISIRNNVFDTTRKPALVGISGAGNNVLIEGNQVLRTGLYSDGNDIRRQTNVVIQNNSVWLPLYTDYAGFATAPIEWQYGQSPNQITGIGIGGSVKNLNVLNNAFVFPGRRSINSSNCTYMSSGIDVRAGENVAIANNSVISVVPYNEAVVAWDHIVGLEVGALTNAVLINNVAMGLNASVWFMVEDYTGYGAPPKHYKSLYANTNGVNNEFGYAYGNQWYYTNTLWGTNSY